VLKPRMASSAAAGGSRGPTRPVAYDDGDG
jgi:hypothetical protein